MGDNFKIDLDHNSSGDNVQYVCSSLELGTFHRQGVESYGQLCLEEPVRLYLS